MPSFPRVTIVVLLFAVVMAAPNTARSALFRLPVHNESGAVIMTMWQEGQTISTPWVIGVDHDPAPDPNGGRDDCLNYHGERGIPWCYDDHSGTDFMLSGGFDAMDRGSAQVLAAAAGTVTHVEDGHYDRCHTDLATQWISCDGNEMRANYIEVDHGGGYVTIYYHLMKSSMLVSEGDVVTCGQPLALIGSSGISSAPHLHFQFELNGDAIDPFAGPESQPESYWVLQEGAYGLPGEYCEGDTLPGDVVEPTPAPDAADSSSSGEPDTDEAPDVNEPTGEDVVSTSADQDDPFWWSGKDGGFSCSPANRTPPQPFAALLLLVLAAVALPRYVSRTQRPE